MPWPPWGSAALPRVTILPTSLGCFCKVLPQGMYSISRNTQEHLGWKQCPEITLGVAFHSPKLEILPWGRWETQRWFAVLGHFRGRITSVYEHSRELVAQMVKNLPEMQEIRVWSLGWEDPLEKGMTTHSSILVWRISWTKDLVGYSPWGHKESYLTEKITLSLSWEFQGRPAQLVKSPEPQTLLLTLLLTGALWAWASHSPSLSFYKMRGVGPLEHGLGQWLFHKSQTPLNIWSQLWTASTGKCMVCTLLHTIATKKRIHLFHSKNH